MLLDLAPIRALLATSHTIAMVGLSPKEARPSNLVARYLLAAGYTVIPVNPGQSEILGLACYPSLSDIPGAVDIVDIFRRAEDVPPLVEEAIRIKARAVWMQEGIVHQDAAAMARDAGLLVVMDRCIKTVHHSMMAS